MKPIFITFALLAALVSGCGGECGSWESLPVKIDAREEYEVVAVEEMNEAFGLNLFEVDPEGIPIYYVKIGDSKLGSAAGRAYTFCSGGMIESGEIYITEVYQGGLGIRNIVAHEIFHILGSRGHLQDGLMQTITPFGPKDLTGPLSDLITDEMRDWVDATYPEALPR